MDPSPSFSFFSSRQYLDMKAMKELQSVRASAAEHVHEPGKQQRRRRVRNVVPDRQQLASGVRGWHQALVAARMLQRRVWPVWQKNLDARVLFPAMNPRPIPLHRPHQHHQPHPSAANACHYACLCAHRITLGGSGCSRRPGGAKQCCRPAILLQGTRSDSHALSHSLVLAFYMVDEWGFFLASSPFCPIHTLLTASHRLTKVCVVRPRKKSPASSRMPQVTARLARASHGGGGRRPVRGPALQAHLS